MNIQPYYKDDMVTLYNGDCLELDAWISADVLVTDPPYGVAWKVKSFSSSQKLRTQACKEFANDENVQVRDDMLTMWGRKPAILFGSWRKPRPVNTRHRLIYFKTKTRPGVRQGPWYPADEEIYVIGDGWQGPPVSNVYVCDT